MNIRAFLFFGLFSRYIDSQRSSLRLLHSVAVYFAWMIAGVFWTALYLLQQSEFPRISTFFNLACPTVVTITTFLLLRHAVYRVIAGGFKVRKELEVVSERRQYAEGRRA